MKTKFIIKPPVKDLLKREFLIFRNKFEAKEELTEKEGIRNAKNLAKEAVYQGFQRIIFVGGDGLLNEGINGVMEATGGKIPSDFILGTIPSGSGNNFAKALGITKDVKKCFEIIKKGKTTAIDLGQVNDRFFLNCFSVGFDAMINKVANNLKEKYQFLPKDLSYLLAAIKEIIIKIPTFQFKIKGQGIDLDKKVILVAITNGPTYGAIFKVNPGACCNDGKFDVCIIDSVGKLRAFYDIYRVIRGTHTCLPEFSTFKVSSLTISSPEPIPYETDGEVFEGPNEFKINILPKAINFLVP